MYLRRGAGAGDARRSAVSDPGAGLEDPKNQRLGPFAHPQGEMETLTRAEPRDSATVEARGSGDGRDTRSRMRSSSSPSAHTAHTHELAAHSWALGSL